MMKVLVTAFVLFSATLFVVSCSSEKAQSKNTTKTTTTENYPSTTPVAQSDASVLQFTASDLDGNMQNSSTWVGKQPLVINFWGTWCPPCRKEIPDLVRLYKEYHPKGVEIVGLAVRDTPEKVRAFSKKNGMEWVMLMANNEVAYKFKISSVPTTIFVDRNGKVVEKFIGMRGYEAFKKAFESIL